jgi:hypothetical protein
MSSKYFESFFQVYYYAEHQEHPLHLHSATLLSTQAASPSGRGYSLDRIYVKNVKSREISDLFNKKWTLDCPEIFLIDKRTLKIQYNP